tara:strand:- start:41944 stop:43122 length:1179 start_codon:yes stop_codon:yes gene_type:complete
MIGKILTMSSMLSFPPVRLTEDSLNLRAELREFISESRKILDWKPRSNFMSTFSSEFSKMLGSNGYLGITWPSQYGGQDRSALDRFVITEELLAAGAPVAAHWVAERQSGPLLIRYGNEKQKQVILPKIASGECYFSIGMSEPNSGSDLASIRTRAENTGQSWKITGTKVWTSNAHKNHWMILLARTSPPSEKRHEGMSQFLIDLKNDKMQINPIPNMLGQHEFNEVVMEEMEIPLDRLIGQEGNGWQQVTAELAFERSGPERFLSSYNVLLELIKVSGNQQNTEMRKAVGKIVSRLMALRTMSISIAGMLERGENPDIAAAVVKDSGNDFEQQVIEITREVLAIEPICKSKNSQEYESLMADLILQLPSFSFRGGTPEIMRSIIARGLGVR